MDFADRGTRDLYNGIASKAARSCLPVALHEVALDKLTLLEAATRVDQLRISPGNRLEVLRGKRAGQHSIRVDERYRVCFRWTDAGPVDVEIVDHHCEEHR